MSGPIWIREGDIARFSLRDVIALLRKALAREAAGVALNMEKTHVGWGEGNMHAIGAVFTDSGLLGVKTWAHTRRGATPLEILWDAETGKLLAIIEAFAMGQLRTSGMAGLATDCLADISADLMAVCGTGKQALAQIAAVAAVRPLKRVHVWSRNPERRDEFAARVRAYLNLEAETFEAVASAVGHVPVITLITRATSPFLTADMPARGAHINAMGAITPERSEFEPDLLERCAVVAVDTVVQARALSAELIAASRNDFERPQQRPLSHIVASGAGRPSGADLTLFKSLGVGIADLALAEEIYRQARTRGVGHELPTPAPTPLNFAPVERSS